MDLNVIFAQTEKEKKIASTMQKFSNADACGDALPR